MPGYNNKEPDDQQHHRQPFMMSAEIGKPYGINPYTKRKNDHAPFYYRVGQKTQANQREAGEQHRHNSTMNGA